MARIRTQVSRVWFIVSRVLYGINLNTTSMDMDGHWGPKFRVGTGAYPYKNVVYNVVIEPLWISGRILFAPTKNVKNH
jgi:hypothetical protein